MNEITYVAVEMNRSDKLDYSFGSFAHVFVNGSWKFSLNAKDKWTGEVLIVMFTNMDAESIEDRTACFHMMPSLLHDNLRAIAQVYPPF
jgi:hypothetical protein